MRPILLIIMQSIFPLLLNDCLFAQSGGLRATQYRINSTLEVLQDADIYPSRTMLCGPGCLYIGARYLGIGQYSIDEIAKMADWSFSDGTNMLDLQNACRKMSLYAEAFELNATRLADLMDRCNAMAIIESKKHYYVLLKANDGKFFCATIPLKTDWVEAKKLAELWDGKALLFSKSPIRAEIGYSKLPLVGGLVGFALIGVIGLGHLLKKSVSAGRVIEATNKTTNN